MASNAFTTANLPLLRSQVDAWTAKQLAPTGYTSSLPGSTTDGGQSEAKDVFVAFRTRPPLEGETSRFATSVNEASDPAEETKNESDGQVPGLPEFCKGISVPSAEPGVFVAHVPAMKWNGITLQHKSFDSDLAFGPDTTNDEVYARTVAANQLLPLAIQGGVGCILAYGQTGTGKTYTMEGLEARLACDLFTVAAQLGSRFLEAESQATDTRGEVKSGTDVYKMSVTFLELLGRHVVDLVEEPTQFDEDGNPMRNEVVVQEDRTGDVSPRLTSTAVESADELQALIAKSLSHRRTSATARNATSSRSHALLCIRIKNTLLLYAEEGQLILVDLAGSERYEDSKLHNKQRMDESRENNKSLMNLKECVRAKAKMANEDGFVHIPWRSNKLTLLLKPIFDVESRQPSRAIIIAHVSPHIQDSTHSINTLGYAAPFKTAPPKPKGPAPYDAADPRTWNNEQTVSWLEAEFDKHECGRLRSEYVLQKRKKGIRDPPPLDFSRIKIRRRVDLSRVCPNPMTARNIGKMYTVEFIKLCLKAAEPWVSAKTTELQILKQYAAEVANQLFYLMMTAKTRTRKEVMKTRNKLDVNIYGEAPHRDDRATQKKLGGQYEFFKEDTSDAELLKQVATLGIQKAEPGLAAQA